MSDRTDFLYLLLTRRNADTNVDFDDLRRLLRRLGFEEQIRGSHHAFRMNGIEERINLQRDGRQAKPYQVKQVRKVILRYKLGVFNDG